MEVKELLPIGTVVLLKDGTKRLMIFGVRQTDNESGIEYDYIGVLYPEGNIGEEGQFLFNHENIAEVFYKGYEDEERDKFLEQLDRYYKNKQIPEAEKKKLDTYMIVGHVPVFRLNETMANTFYRTRYYMDIDSGSGFREQGGVLGCYCVTTDEEIYM